MDIDLNAFHFLRPAWLLLAAAGLAVLWARRGEAGLLGWRSAIAPGLLPYLVVRTPGSAGPRPVHALAALLVLAGLGAAGPTWQKDRPPFLDDRAPLMVAVDLSPSMDAADVPPTRLEALKHKLRDLLERRRGAKTGLVAYAGTAHLVLPPTDDPALLDLFVQALSTTLIPAPGKDAAGAIDVARAAMRAGQAGGTVLLATDGADAAQLDTVRDLVRKARLQVMVLAVGQRDEGVIRDGQGRPRVGPDGKPALGSFDADGLTQLARAASAPLGSLTLDGDDLDWIELHAQRHYESVQDEQQAPHWKDAGYWLCWPLAVIALLCVRRGWNVNWTAGVLLGLAVSGAPAPSAADPLADAFFTRDQQGRWAFEHRDAGRAASLFRDPYWKGRSAYQAGDYPTALAAFARLDTADGYFYLGNTQARLHSYADALAAYDQALRLRPDFPQARANRQLVEQLLAAIQAEQAEQGAQPPDDTHLDNQRGKGRSVQQPSAAPSADQWLRNLTMSPAGFLQRKFGIEDAQRRAGAAKETP